LHHLQAEIAKAVADAVLFNFKSIVLSFKGNTYQMKKSDELARGFPLVTNSQRKSYISYM